MKPPIETLVVEGESGDIFVVANGVKIAQRVHPGTPHAETWVPLEAGWTVIDCEGGSTIEVTYEGVRIYLVLKLRGLAVVTRNCYSAALQLRRRRG